MINDHPIVLHRGIYKKTATLSEAIFMITGLTIGAGILGIPYVVAQAGLVVGLAQIAGLGIITLFLNIMIGEIAVKAQENMQLPGLAQKYLGSSAKAILSIILAFGSLGALLAYVVGEGAALAALFGGDAFSWSIIFWSLASYFVWRGLGTVKIFEKIVSFAVILIIVFLSVYLLPAVRAENFFYFNLGNIFLPFGVILFALNGAPAIAEAHALLPGQPRAFRRAVVIGTLIPIVVYLLFAVAVVGVSGQRVSEVATVGLGAQFGAGISVLANVFAILAMATGFVGLGTALRDTLRWDYRLSGWLATLFVISFPLTLFLLGIKSFVAILGVVGGLFIAVESIFMVIIYWVARRRGDATDGGFAVRHALLLGIPVLIIFTIVALLSIAKFFVK